MSLSLAELQAKFQRGVLTSDDEMLGLIRTPPNDTPRVMFGVYRNAYVLRLIEFLANDHEKLKAYLGDEQFAEMARAYVKAYPSDQPNARWYARHLPEFLAQHEAYSPHAELAELAALEKALNDSFDAPDSDVLTINDLARVDPNAFDKARFEFHPSAIRLQFKTNVTDVWSVLKAAENPLLSFAQRMGEGGRRPDEGSCDGEAQTTDIGNCGEEEPSSALLASAKLELRSGAAGSGTFSHPPDGRRGKIVEPVTLGVPAEILVWRQSSASRFRQLSAEETMAFDEARNGVPFGVLCEMIAMMDDPDNAALRAATYLRGWIESELICKIET
jgi:hypothetical protein